jgi:hypothetical protein
MSALADPPQQLKHTELETSVEDGPPARQAFQKRGFTTGGRES